MKIGQKQISQALQAATGAVRRAATTFEVVKSPADRLKQDVVEIAGVQKTQHKQTVRATKEVSSAASLSYPDVQLTKTLTVLGEKNLFNKEILAFLTRSRSEGGELLYNQYQRNVISAAIKKINKLKIVATKLADDAKRAEKEAVDEIKALFPAKYKDCFEHRAKSKESTFDKLVNNVREDVDKFRNELYKEHFKVNYKGASDADKDKFFDLIMSGKLQLTDAQWKRLTKIFSISKHEQKNAKELVKDQIGLRLLLPTGNKTETSEVTDIIEKAISGQKLTVTRVSNYSKDGIKPYVDNKRIAGWQELDHRIPALVNYNKSKDNGYTTFQMNIIFRNGFPGEFQMRSRKMNIVCNGEHTFYDLLENKDITKGVQELKEYYEKAGVFSLVRELKENPVTFNSYMTYIKDSYKKTRDTALGAEYPMPVLSNYIDNKYEMLSLENLCKMADEVKEIQKRYPRIFG